VVPAERAEKARALMLELFPEGFEERDARDGVELAAYTDAGGEERLWAAFGTVSSEAVPQDWETRWRAFHRPVRVGPLWIGPPWEQVPASSDAVVIDPGRAFGTGGHPTTRLSLQLLLELGAGSLLDVGCGSGVLAIAAARLGFAPVIGIDHDEAALEAAARNADANGVSLDLRQADALLGALPATDALVANVSAAFVPQLAGRVRAAGLIVSGYFESDRPEVPGYRAERRAVENGWAADLLRRESRVRAPWRVSPFAFWAARSRTRTRS
jgi:ribosomal protein L11 methyltransferase